MEYAFTCRGHKNVRSMHENTLEFTKDTELTERGDCIIGVAADFEYFKIKEFLLANKESKLVFDLRVKELSCQVQCSPNLEFSDKHELVLRKGDYLSPRTLGIFANKAARDIPREVVSLMKDPQNILSVTLRAL